MILLLRRTLVLVLVTLGLKEKKRIDNNEYIMHNWFNFYDDIGANIYINMLSKLPFGFSVF